MTCQWGCTEFAPDDEDCRRYGLGAMALRYAWLGYAVLPLVPGGKRPHPVLGRHGGVHKASRDPAQIRSWWSSCPDANVGVATGSASRLCVVDLDVKNADNGLHVFRAFLAQHGLAVGRCPVALTPSGGSHLWLRTPPGAVVPERPGILPAVDVKGDGGYVCAYPSAVSVVPGDRSGGTTGAVPVPYAWAGCPHEAPPWPGWMAGWLDGQGRHGAGSRHGQDGSGLGSRDGSGEDGLAVGSRNRGMHTLACSLYRIMGTSPGESGEVLARLREVWEKTDRNGFPWSEVLVCAESARRFIEWSREAENERYDEFLGWLRRRG